MMNMIFLSLLLRTLRGFSEFYFFLLGFGYLFALLLWNNQEYVWIAEIYFRLADTPALFCGLFYALATVRIDTEYQYREDHNGSTKDFVILDFFLVIIGIFIFLGFYWVDVFSAFVIGIQNNPV
jgi:hypothetical protein